MGKVSPYRKQTPIAKSDDKGMFHLKQIPSSPFFITLLHEKYARIWFSVPELSERQEPQEFHLPESAPVQGTVQFIDFNGEDEIKSFQVSATYPTIEEALHHTLEVEPDNTFYCNALPVGEADIQVYYKTINRGSGSQTQQVFITPDMMNVVDFQIHRGTATLDINIIGIAPDEIEPSTSLSAEVEYFVDEVTTTTRQLSNSFDFYFSGLYPGEATLTVSAILYNINPHIDNRQEYTVPIIINEGHNTINVDVMNGVLQKLDD